MGSQRLQLEFRESKSTEPGQEEGAGTSGSVPQLRGRQGGQRREGAGVGKGAWETVKGLEQPSRAREGNPLGSVSLSIKRRIHPNCRDSCSTLVHFIFFMSALFLNYIN